MRTPAISVLLIWLILTSFALGAEPMSSREAFARHLLISHPAPQPPLQLRLRKQHFQGDGMFELAFDFESGRVRDVRVLQSTGNSLLDRNTVITLKGWHAQPRTIHLMRLPITFIL